MEQHNAKITGKLEVLNGVKIAGGGTLDSKELEAVESTGENYIRYRSGLQICYGSVFPNINTGDYQKGQISYAQAFVNNQYAISLTLRRGTIASYRNATFTAHNPTNTGCGFMWYGETKNEDRWHMEYIAIGRWK